MFTGRMRKQRLWKDTIILIGLAFFCSSDLLAAAERQMTLEYSTCLKKTNGVTVEVLDCISAELKRQDVRLNENYNKLMSKLSGDRKKALVEAQRAWIKFRDADCGFYYDPQGGSSAHMASNECVLNATADRANELKSLTNGQ